MQTFSAQVVVAIEVENAAAVMRRKLAMPFAAGTCCGVSPSSEMVITETKKNAIDTPCTSMGQTKSRNVACELSCVRMCRPTAIMMNAKVAYQRAS